MAGALVPTMLLLVGSSGPTVSAGPPDALSPLSLFTSACTEGSVALPKGSVAPVAYAKLPAAAKLALAHSARRLDKPGILRPPAAKDVPNSIYRIGKRDDVFLMVPAAEAPTGGLGESCAVIWKGEDYAEARSLVLPDPRSARGAGALPRDNALGLAYVATISDGLALTAAALQGWIVLKSAPAAPGTGGDS